MTALHATDTNFHDITNTGKPVLIDFWATWCGPCRQVSPIIDAIANDHPEYTIVKVDIDHAPNLAQQFGIRGVPTLIVLNTDGTTASQTNGPLPKAALLTNLANAT